MRLCSLSPSFPTSPPAVLRLRFVVHPPTSRHLPGFLSPIFRSDPPLEFLSVCHFYLSNSPLFRFHLISFFFPSHCPYIQLGALWIIWAVCLLLLPQTVFSITIGAFNRWPLGHITSNEGGKVNWVETFLMQNRKSHREVIPVFQPNVSISTRKIHSCISLAVVILQNTPDMKWSDEFLSLRLNCVYTYAPFNTVQCKAVLFSPWHKRWVLLGGGGGRSIGFKCKPEILFKT